MIDNWTPEPISVADWNPQPIRKVKDALGRCHDDKGHLVSCNGGSGAAGKKDDGKKKKPKSKPSVPAMPKLIPDLAYFKILPDEVVNTYSTWHERNYVRCKNLKIRPVDRLSPVFDSSAVGMCASTTMPGVKFDIIFLNPNYMLNNDSFLNKGKKADIKYGFPHQASMFRDPGTSRVQAIIDHEFGHHVHFNLKADKATYGAAFDDLERIFRKAKQIDYEGVFPTELSRSTPNEWFAENWSIYATDETKGRVEPDLAELFEALLDGDVGGFKSKTNKLAESYERGQG